jgi:8-oxo-dGTP pyrophosphatase MutT (NUDIX family)
MAGAPAVATSALVFAINNDKVLLASGGKFAKDTKTNPRPGPDIPVTWYDFARVDKGTGPGQANNEVDAEKIIMNRLTNPAQDAMLKPGGGIAGMNVSLNKAKDKYFATIVSQSNSLPEGFIKGGIEAALPPAALGAGAPAPPPETSQQAAQREFREELSTVFPEGRFIEVTPGAVIDVDEIKCFYIVLDNQEATAVKTNWQRNHTNKIGEVNDVHFVRITDIPRLRLNPKSTSVIPFFNRIPEVQRVQAAAAAAAAVPRYVPPNRRNPGGRRKTRRRSRKTSRMLKKPKTLKKRVR